MIRQKRPHAPQAVELLPLTPQYDPDDHGIYFSVLNAALTGEHQNTIFNIALTGGYGVGKSSILQKVAKQYPKRVVQVSLSTLGLSDDSGEGSPQGTTPLSRTNRIQKEIVKQLLYREDPARTPGSRFRRIGRLKFWRELGTAFLAGFVIALLFYLTGWTGQLAELGGPELGLGLGVQVVALAVAAGFVLAIRMLSHHRIRIEKVSAGAATISLSQESTSYFDQYLDEIVYFFDATRRDIVIFEDIDRFDDPNIFESLRALNTLLNGAEQLRRRNIRFIYAIKDSIFDEFGTKGARVEGGMDPTELGDAAELALVRANRTKFFDLVVPVVPFITHRSARDLMSKLMVGLEQPVSPDLIDLAARDVADMRLIKNIRNEFIIFVQKVIPSDGSGLTLNPDSLFAMMLYKATHLADFEAVRTGNSKIDTLYRAGRDLVSQNIERLNAEAREARDQLKKLESASTRAKVLGAHLVEYVERIQRHVNISGSDWRLDGTPVTTDEFHQPEFWERLIEGAGSLTSNCRVRSSSYRQTITITLKRADLSEILSDPLSLQEWQESERASLLMQLDNIQKQRHFLAHADMHELMEAGEFKLKGSDGSENTFRQLAHAYLGSDLARRLVEAGYINRDFTLYTSTFHAERVSSLR